MNNHPSLDTQRDTLTEIIIKYASGITLATVAFVILGWLAGF